MEDDFELLWRRNTTKGRKLRAYRFNRHFRFCYLRSATAPDPDFTGYALDAVSGESTGTLLDTYINKGFNGKYLRDEESCEMLRLCLESRVYDLSIIYTKWGGLFTKLYGLTHNTKIDLASLNASVEDSVRQSLQEMIDMYKDID